jgi:hypothetical protein
MSPRGLYGVSQKLSPRGLASVLVHLGVEQNSPYLARIIILETHTSCLYDSTSTVQLRILLGIKPQSAWADYLLRESHPYATRSTSA